MVFYDDGLWGDNGILKLWQFCHSKCSVLISALLSIPETEITDAMKKDITHKFGWRIHLMDKMGDL